MSNSIPVYLEVKLLLKDDGDCVFSKKVTETRQRPDTQQAWLIDCIQRTFNIDASKEIGRFVRFGNVPGVRSTNIYIYSSDKKRGGYSLVINIRSQSGVFISLEHLTDDELDERSKISEEWRQSVGVYREGKVKPLKHITGIKAKTAEVLAAVNLIDDHYHNAIKESALEQVRSGNPLSVYGGKHDKVWWHTKLEWEALQASRDALARHNKE